MTEFKIGKNLISAISPTYFIADIAANHDGDLERAKDLIYLAAEAGAHAAKFQNFRADAIVSRVGFENLTQNQTHQSSWKKSVYEVYQDASINQDWTPILKETCTKAGIDYFTSPYDFQSIDAVDPYVEVYKIGSGDITWLEIIEYMAKKGKPILLATGASSMSDVERAMATIDRYTQNVVLMQCNTNYTASVENFHFVNLRVLETFRTRFPKVILGLSDHTPGHATVLGAIALGARVVEKHFTDSNDRTGPDHRFSMNPSTWKEMILRSRELQAALGDGIKRIEDNEKNSAIVQRRGLRATRPLNSGTIIQASDLIPLRPIPVGGLNPHQLPELIGKTLTRNLAAGEHITEEHFK